MKQKDKNKLFSLLTKKFVACYNISRSRKEETHD